MSAAATQQDNVLWGMVKLGLILAVYAVASCTVLAVVNNITAPVIAANNERKANEAMRQVFADADAFVDPEDSLCGTIDGKIVLENFKLATANGAVIGGIAQVSGPTYDHATIMVGVDMQGVITGMQFLENTDSPGFGSKASDAGFTVRSGQTFYGQFAGKKVADGFVPDVTFDAISGATITSKGVADLLRAGTSVIVDYLKEHNND